jgi:hypothetical protein
MRKPFAGVGDTWPIGTRQEANSTTVIYPLLTRFCRYYQVTTDVGQTDSTM